MDLYFKRSQRGDGKRTLTLISSRGCPFDCNFCSIHSISSHLWRARSAENVLEEVNEAYRQYGIQHIEIEDDNFTLDRERALAILCGLKYVGPITWSAHNGVRIDTLDKELLQVIKDSGCIQLNIAVEHGSEIVLDQMNKRLSLQKVREVVQECSRLNINTVGFCIVGYPGETREAFIESAEFYKEMKLLGLTCVAPFIVNAYPGTRLYDQAKQNGWLNPETDDHFFCMEDNFVSVTTSDFDANEVLKRLRVMGMINGNPHINVAQLV
jgi:magnesium-protoporphyrin IX monomethyl ester (oxidative) cyclase